jgi:LacI family transcriptional regulator
LSRSTFRGEGDREQGFRAALRDLAPGLPVHVVAGTDGLDASITATVSAALDRDPALDAVYSVGGGNRAVLSAFDAAGRRIRAFVAHDLDAENVVLLRQRRLTAVLHHDLRTDVRRVCRAVMQARGALPGRPGSHPSQIQVITPFNEPAGLVEAG